VGECRRKWPESELAAEVSYNPAVFTAIFVETLREKEIKKRSHETRYATEPTFPDERQVRCLHSSCHLRSTKDILSADLSLDGRPPRGALTAIPSAAHPPPLLHLRPRPPNKTPSSTPCVIRNRKDPNKLMLGTTAPIRQFFLPSNREVFPIKTSIDRVPTETQLFVRRLPVGMEHHVTGTIASVITGFKPD
jgi:hypothetical protein